MYDLLWSPANLCNNFSLAAHFEYSLSVILGGIILSVVPEMKRVGHVTDPILSMLSNYKDIKMVHTNVFKSSTNFNGHHKMSYLVFIPRLWNAFY